MHSSWYKILLINGLYFTGGFPIGFFVNYSDFILIVNLPTSLPLSENTIYEEYECSGNYLSLLRVSGKDDIPYTIADVASESN